MNFSEKMLKTQMKMGYWPGYTMAMYPNQFAYDEIEVDFEKIWKDRNEVNLYYHVPFCKSLCPYCGFFTIAQNDEEYIKKYVDKLNEQVKTYFSYFGKKGIIKSICYGGGTPNHLPVGLHYKIMDTLHQVNAEFDSEIEPSMEVSPEIITEEYVKSLREIGIKRLSLGVQSLNLDLRTKINRANNYNLLDLVDIIRTNDMNMNIDVMSGIAGQSQAMFMDTLEKLMEFKPETISIYPLAGKDSSMFKKDSQIMTNKEKYELFREYYDYLKAQGYYCESNVKFVKKNQKSTHQQKIYEYQGVDTMGVGCAARSYNYYTHYSIEHRFNPKNRKQLLDEYMNKDFRELKYYGIHMSEAERKSRYVIYGLFIGSLDTLGYMKQFGTSVYDDFGEKMEAIRNLELVKEKDNGNIELTKEGRIYTDLICTLFWSDDVAKKYKESKGE